MSEIKKIELTSEQLISYIKEHKNSVIITQDKILANNINARINAAVKKEQSTLSVRRSNIMTLSNFYERLWKQIEIKCIFNDIILPQVIDNFSEYIIWRDFIFSWKQENPEERNLLNPNGTAKAMRRSWSTLAQYSCLKFSAPFIENFPSPIKDDSAFRNRDGNLADHPAHNYYQSLQSSRIVDKGYLQEDHTVFLSIAEQYSRYMSENRVFSRILLPNVLAHFLKEFKDSIPHYDILLANFHEMTPQILSFFEHASEMGWQIKRSVYKAGSSRRLILKDTDSRTSPFENMEQELTHAIKEAQSFLDKNPGKTAGIVIPGLRDNFRLFRLTADKALMPEAMILGLQDTPRPYKSISGIRISAYPAVQDLLTVISLAAGKPIERQKIIDLLHSCFIRSYSREYEKRAMICSDLRQDFRSAYTLEELSQLIGSLNYKHENVRSKKAKNDKNAEKEKNDEAAEKAKKQTNNNPIESILGRTLKIQKEFLSGQEADKQKNTKTTLENWAKFALIVINIWVCPYTASILKPADGAAASGKAVSSLKLELKKFFRTGNFYKKDQKISFADFMQYLNLVLWHQEIEPAAQRGTRLYLLTPSQAEKINLDHARLIGFDSDTFPPKHIPNGYIPDTLLAAAGVPRSSSRLCTAYALKNLKNICASAGTLTVSFAENRNKNGSLMPVSISPLYKTLFAPEQYITEKAEQKAANPCMELSKSIHENEDRYFESINPEDAPPEAKPNKYDKEHKIKCFRGGASLITDQANCPMRAFLKHRLECADINEDKKGLNHIDRGTITHKLMEKFWKSLNNLRDACRKADGQEEIYSSDMLSREDIMDDLIKKTVQEVFSSTNADKISGILKENEESRIIDIIKLWLEAEKNKAVKKFNVQAIEKTNVYSIKDKDDKEILTVIGRVDRQDTSASSSVCEDTIIIDYKTGSASADKKKWIVEKDNNNQILTLPQKQKNYQLPMYSCFGEDNCTEICFAKLVKEEAAFEALSDSTLGTPAGKGFESSWEQQKKVWKELIQQTAQSFIEGSISKNKNMCGSQKWQCPFKSFCFPSDDEEYENAD